MRPARPQLEGAGAPHPPGPAAPRRRFDSATSFSGPQPSDAVGLPVVVPTRANSGEGLAHCQRIAVCSAHPSNNRHLVCIVRRKLGG